MFKKIWGDPVWSKVIATLILSALAVLWAGLHFNWWPLILATSPVPHWLLGLLIIMIVASASTLVAVMMKTPRMSAAVDDPASPTTSPRLIVKCPDNDRNLIITNDGQDAAVNIELGPLVHEEEHDITVLRTPFGSIPAKATEQRRITVAQRQPNSIGPLWDAMRFGCTLPQPVDSVTVKFDDTNGNKFAQKFELISEVDGSVTWKPGPVTFR